MTHKKTAHSFLYKNRNIYTSSALHKLSYTWTPIRGLQMHTDNLKLFSFCDAFFNGIYVDTFIFVINKRLRGISNHPFRKLAGHFTKQV